MNFYDKNLFPILTRKHWWIENKLHWILDVHYCEDKSRSRKGNTPYMLNALRKFSIGLLQFGQKYINESSLRLGHHGEMLKMNPKIIEYICICSILIIFVHYMYAYMEQAN